MSAGAETELGEVARDLANAMVAKIIETIDEFPTSRAGEHSAIARFVAAKLIAYAEKVGA